MTNEPGFSLLERGLILTPPPPFAEEIEAEGFWEKPSGRIRSCLRPALNRITGDPEEPKLLDQLLAANGGEPERVMSCNARRKPEEIGND